jgi:cytochrome c oxidase assembly factor CtaG
VVSSTLVSMLAGTVLLYDSLLVVHTVISLLCMLLSMPRVRKTALFSMDMPLHTALSVLTSSLSPAPVCATMYK